MYANIFSNSDSIKRFQEADDIPLLPLGVQTNTGGLSALIGFQKHFKLLKYELTIWVILRRVVKLG